MHPDEQAKRHFELLEHGIYMWTGGWAGAMLALGVCGKLLMDCENALICEAIVPTVAKIVTTEVITLSGIALGAYSGHKFFNWINNKNVTDETRPSLTL
jgi:hypothetical protein